ncbi:hypothetical protein T190115A13A_60196 [Tenacibaculum sp. 190524A02b]|uniref:Transposase n=1 Tax=Tenacibaculum vairaonense TaxID=3137860 RepID=A0ABP1FCY7_9FLAO
MKELAKKILYQVYQKETPTNIKKVVKILKTDETDPATDICDVLGIERRHNRAEIRKVISQNQ